MADRPDLVHFREIPLEGAEIEMLDGAKKILENNENVKILIELHGKNYKRTWKLLKDHDFWLKYVCNAKGMLDVFKKRGFEQIQTFPNCQRAVFEGMPVMEDWCSEKINGKKLVRSVLWVK